MYSNADVSRLVQVHTNAQMYDIDQGSTRLPEIAKVPYLDVVGALNSSGTRLTLFCVNRHLTRDIGATIDVAGFRAILATAHSIFAGSIYEKNDENEPDRIHPQASSLPVGSPELRYSFRHESVTVIEFDR